MVEISRRQLLRGLGIIGAGAGALAVLELLDESENGMKADVCVQRAGDYEADLQAQISDGFERLDFSDRLSGKRVLLKPNLVETALGHAHINTHPAVVLAAARAIRELGGDPFVAEGQGHRRDSWLVLEESGMAAVLAEGDLEFVDLNHDEPVEVENAGKVSELPSIWLPRQLVEADLVISMPKVKTHHWAGITCAMKNFFGALPGIVYGWPKNMLHVVGIPQAIVDLNATIAPHFAIADGVVGMDGDGPIMGAPKPLGALVMSASLPALDATCARLMRLNPLGAMHLPLSSGWLGPILEENITQVGAPIDELATDFEVLDYPHLAALRDV